MIGEQNGDYRFWFYLRKQVYSFHVFQTAERFSDLYSKQIKQPIERYIRMQRKLSSFARKSAASNEKN